MISKNLKEEIIKRIIKDMEREDVVFLYASNEENLINCETFSEFFSLIAITIWKIKEVFGIDYEETIKLIEKGIREL